METRQIRYIAVGFHENGGAPPALLLFDEFSTADVLRHHAKTKLQAWYGKLAVIEVYAITDPPVVRQILE